MTMKGRNWSPVGTRRRGLKSFAARLTLRFLAVASIVVMYHLIELHLRYREAMRAKYLPTQFDSLSDYDEATLASTGWDADSYTENTERSTLLDNRQHWKKLGKGREGETFTFNNTVIKVYNEETTPFRNCMQDTRASPTRWPTEIPASLIMGGHRDGSTPPNDDPYRELFVPVKDYFLTTITDPSQPPKWHLVTPFLKSGTLKKLAKTLHAASDGSPTYRELDQMFRPSFESLLSALDNLHMAHNLCHDDVKLDNIFVASESDPRRWKLGDLGNAREPDHPYHLTPLWTADTPQLRDCRANDALRLTKAYLQFLRRSGRNPDEFDDALMRGVDTLSRLYWTIARASPPVSAAQIWQLSGVYPPQLEGAEQTPWLTMQPAGVKESRGWAPAAEAVFGWRWSLRNAVKSELRVGAKENMGRFFGLTRILGIPVAACQAA
ncbi:Putative serine/threonine-protein kinase, active [Colletotrichum destructivum]|uniref:Serine/threonine-protein kinase, active n=1 Tax=Colletotrichum destructivum TaxID=34406 RepID=A0AAX4IPV1_9PEZI|nr:Putative serine/threonine-protein kinase, active [Colletotrichum destructivum]